MTSLWSWKSPFLPTAFLTKRSEQPWSEVYNYKKSIFDQKFWAKIPPSEVYKNCVSYQIQWSEMTKIFGHYFSIKMLRQKRSEQLWSVVYKKCIFGQKFWAKIPWPEVYKNGVSDQIQWSEITKKIYHYCSLKMLCQIIKLHLEQSGTWISCLFGQIAHFLIKAPKLA